MPDISHGQQHIYLVAKVVLEGLRRVLSVAKVSRMFKFVANCLKRLWLFLVFAAAMPLLLVVAAVSFPFLNWDEDEDEDD